MLNHSFLRWIKIARYELRGFVTTKPSLFLPLARIKERSLNGGARVVDPATDIVIEGFPRSANTFAVAAFQSSQRQPINIAHHFHAPAQIITAAQMGIPTIVLIRPPEDAIISMLLRTPMLTPLSVARNYVRFYQSIENYSKSYVVAPFDIVISDFGRVIRAVNEVFKKNYSLFVPDENNVEKVFQIVEAMHKMDSRRTVLGESRDGEDLIARPSKRRKEKKRELKRLLNEQKIKKVISRAQTLYGKFIEFSKMYY